jgi:NDP-sugar pyrophosphorylase family protein
MEAMIFAAGLGTRLYPVTRDRPKALAPLLNGTLLEYNLKNLAAQGIEHFIINTHHFADKIVEYLDFHDNFGLSIDLSFEEELLDTAGGMAKAKKYLRQKNTPVLLYNVDVITNLSLKELLKQHNQMGNDVTLVLRDRPTSRYLLFDSGGLLSGWQNVETGKLKPSHTNPEVHYPKAFSGIQLFSPKVMALLESGRKYSLIDFYLEQMTHLKIGAFSHDHNYWFDCGKPESLQEAQDKLKSECCH